MPPRQLWFFKFGCWATIVSAIVHTAGHLFGQQPPANDTERQLMELATGYRFAFPGGAERSMVNLLDGFSLAFALLLVAMGGIGLIVAKRGMHDVVLMSGVARACAVTSVGLLVISLARFFIAPTLFIAVMATCFLVASVEAPVQESSTGT